MLFRSQIRQVFHTGRIRPESEQIMLLTDRRTSKIHARRPDVETRGQAKIDRVARVVRVGRYTFTFEEWRAVGRLLGD